MGRKRSKNLHLPPRMRARVQKSGAVRFYYDTGAKPRHEIPLGSDYALAVVKWGELEGGRWSQADDVLTFRAVAEVYLRKVVPGKAPRTQRDNLTELRNLYRFFDDPPAALEKIEPQHCKQFLRWRGETAKIRANRELALFSHIWNFAREEGYTDRSNPALGVKRHTERGRKDVDIVPELVDAVYAKACQPLRDALDVAYLSGQRPGDMHRMAETHIRDDALEVRQGKTGAKVRIRLSNEDGTRNELGAVVDRILERKRGHAVRALALIVDERGQPLSRNQLRYRFDKARRLAGVPKAEFQVRDLRAKAATDKADSSGDVRQAQKQLGHASVVTTEHYIRGRRGAKVTPTR